MEDQGGVSYTDSTDQYNGGQFDQLQVMKMLEADSVPKPVVRYGTKLNDSTQAAMLTLMEQGGDNAEMFNRYGEILSVIENSDTVASSVVTQAKQEALERTKLSGRSSLGQLLVNGGISSTDPNVPKTAYDEYVASANGESTHNRFAKWLHANNDSQGVPASELGDLDGLHKINSYISAKAEQQRATNNYWVNKDTSGAGLVAGTAQVIAPFTDQYTLNKIIDNLKDSGFDPENEGVSQNAYLNLGGKKVALSKWLEGLYERNPQEAERAYSTILSSLDSDSGIIFKNDAVSAMRFQELFENPGTYGEGLGGYEDEIDTASHLDNLLANESLCEPITTTSKPSSYSFLDRCLHSNFISL